MHGQMPRWKNMVHGTVECAYLFAHTADKRVAKDMGTRMVCKDTEIVVIDNG